MVEVRDVNAEELEALVAEGKRVLIDFYFDNCGPCKMQKVILKDFAKTAEDIEVLTMELSKNEAIAAKYEIATVPYLLYFQDGKVKERLMGMQQKAVLQATVNG